MSNYSHVMNRIAQENLLKVLGKHSLQSHFLLAL